jgi:hypothetical protein
MEPIMSRTNRPTAVCALLLFALGAPSAAKAGNEIMIDRCRSEVSIVHGYDDRPGSNGAVLLKRGHHGKTAWTPPFRVRTSKSGFIRWWCHSTTGNMFDAGTWRIEEIRIGSTCELHADGSVGACGPDGDLELGSSAWQGWTPERSRCRNRSRHIRARLDGHKLKIECLPP